MKLRNPGPYGSGTVKGVLRIYRTTPGGGAVWPTHWTQIGAASVIAPARTTTVTIPWTGVPRPGHFCLLARWESPARALRGRQARLEQRIRDLARRAPGGGTLITPPGVGALAGRLGSRVLVELVAHGDRLRAVLVHEGRASLHDLGPLADAMDLARRHRFALRRLVTTGDGAAARAGAAHTAAALDRRLFDPLRRRLADRALVIVPVGALHAVPWSALATCAGRAVAVAPSATVWLAADRREPPTAPSARTTRSFSTLEPADGPLFAYEWERVARPPAFVCFGAG